MSKGILLASGCSWTAENSISTDHSLSNEDRGGWAMWPELLANELNLSHLNVAKSGIGNKEIFDSIVDVINTKTNIKLVIVAWSGWDRFKKMGIHDQHPLASLMINECADYSKYKKIYTLDDYSNFFKSATFEDLKKYSRDCIDSSLRYMFVLAQLLKSKNIPYLFFQGLSAFPISITEEIKTVVTYGDNNVIKDFTRSVYYSKIKCDKNIIGFPFFKIIGGHRLSDLTDGISNLEISELDTHPNAKGQKVISDYIKEHYDRVYTV